MGDATLIGLISQKPPKNLAFVLGHEEPGPSNRMSRKAWSAWPHFCWVGNVSLGHCVRAFCVAIARYNIPFSRGFEPMAVVSVIEPAEHPDDYARVPFYPRGTRLAPTEVSHEQVMCCNTERALGRPPRSATSRFEPRTHRGPKRDS